MRAVAQIMSRRLQQDQYLADSDAYMRFVCHAMVRRLMEVERTRLAGR